jgi:hypothetical protein
MPADSTGTFVNIGRPWSHGIVGCLTLCALLAVPVAGCTDSPERRADRENRELQRAAARLEQRSDSDALAAAGLLLQGTAGAKSKALIDRAAHMSERADLAWLHVAVCADDPSCDREALEGRLRRLDPENGAGWLGALDRAGRAHDEAATDAALAEIGRSSRLDIYWMPLIARLSAVTAQAGPTDLEESETVIIGFLAAMPLPAFTNLTKGCRGDALERPGRLASCRGVAASLQRGDTYITEMIGYAIALRVWPADSAEHEATVAARRVGRYRMDAFSRLPIAALKEPAQAKEYLELASQNRREQDVFLEALRRHGTDVMPPADWKDEKAQ